MLLPEVAAGMVEHFVMPAAPDFSWIPDHQLHAALTLAHVDDLTDRCWQALEPYQRDGIVKLRDKSASGRTHVVVTDIPPLPSAIVLYTADALTQLRAALEHTLYAEIEATLGRDLSADEARAVEMPAFDEEKKFDTWLKHKHRRTIDPLQEGVLAASASCSPSTAAKLQRILCAYSSSTPTSPSTECLLWPPFTWGTFSRTRVCPTSGFPCRWTTCAG